MRFRIRGSKLLNIARRLRRDRNGATAVEFALIAPVFFALLFAILETGFIFFAGQYLETATQDAGRLIYTGQAQSSSYSQGQFKTEVCNRVAVLFDCSGIYVDVKSYSSFSTITVADPIDASKNFNTAMSYSPGNAGDVVVVRVFYQWPLFVTGLGYNIANLNGSKRLLSSIIAFRNEPYSG